MRLDGRSECCWVDTLSAPRNSRYRASGSTEVAVVGAGIVGLTTALLLARAGRRVTVLEARTIGRGVTGRSTAKITSQHTLIYARLIRTLGMNRARLYADANDAGVRTVLQLVDDLRIACDLERKDAYAFTLRPDRRSALEREAMAARALGLQADVVARAPLPFANAGAVRFPGQAQFNPARYLTGLASGIRAAGGRVFDHARVTKVGKVKGATRWRLDLEGLHLDADDIVVATNLPIWSPRPFDGRTQPRCHIAMAFRAGRGMSLDGMFIGVDPPAYSLRMGRDRTGPLAVVLGPKFKTGNEKDVARRFDALEAWARSHLNVGAVAWRWVNEDYDSPDRVPFAGELRQGKRRAFVATGFGGWGISNGTAAAMLIADKLMQRPNPWASLYDPSRRTSAHFNRGGESRSMTRSVNDIAPGEGGVVARGRQKIALWKAADGTPHALSASCTHAGCTVTWNNAALTWDCPCHGSMFSREGDVLHGPATEPLKPMRMPARRP